MPPRRQPDDEQPASRLASSMPSSPGGVSSGSAEMPRTRWTASAPCESRRLASRCPAPARRRRLRAGAAPRRRARTRRRARPPPSRARPLRRGRARGPRAVASRATSRATSQGVSARTAVSCSSGTPSARSASGASASRRSTSSSVASRASSCPGAVDVNEAARATTPRACERRPALFEPGRRGRARLRPTRAWRGHTRGGSRTSGSATASSASTCVSCVMATRIDRSAAAPIGAGAVRVEVQRRVLPKDRPLQLLERRARLDPELVDEGPARILVGVQGLRLPAGPVQRRHQVPPQALAERMLGDQCLELADQLVVAPECEVGVDPELDCCQPDLLEPGDRSPGRSSRRRSPASAGPLHSAARRAAARTRRPQAASEQAPRLVHEALEAVEIELVGLDPDDVARRSGPQHVLAEAPCEVARR